MSKPIFHVDRGETLVRGQTLGFPGTADSAGSIDERLETLYAQGLTVHGDRYVYCREEGNLHYEWSFEIVRLNEYPDKPSRFQSVFGSPTLDSARKFARECPGEGAVSQQPTSIWRVECEDYFRADMRMISPRDFIDALDRARLYWRGETKASDPLWELLMTPPVQVVERVDILEPPWD